MNIKKTDMRIILNREIMMSYDVKKYLKKYKIVILRILKIILRRKISLVVKRISCYIQVK